VQAPNAEPKTATSATVLNLFIRYPFLIGAELADAPSHQRRNP
jgi:hypothetical protein